MKLKMISLVEEEKMIKEKLNDICGDRNYEAIRQEIEKSIGERNGNRTYSEIERMSRYKHI